MLSKQLRTFARLTINENLSQQEIINRKEDNIEQILGTRNYKTRSYLSTKNEIAIAEKRRSGWFELSLSKADMPATSFYKLTKIDVYIYKKELAEKWAEQ